MTSQILLPLRTYPDPVGQSAFPAVAALARHLGSRIVGLAVEVDIPDVGNQLAEALLQLREKIRMAEQRSYQEGTRLLEALKEICERAGIVVETQRVRAGPSFIADAMIDFARFSDFVAVPVVSGDVASIGVAESLIFQSGRPVIILPGPGPAQGDLQTVVVATDFGRSATRALFDAMPLLRRAQRVDIVSAVDEKDISKGNRGALMGYLTSQGIAAELINIKLGGSSIGDALQAYATGINSGVLVMGAFGHSRVRDFVLGGATRAILHAPRLPVLMSH